MSRLPWLNALLLAAVLALGALVYFGPAGENPEEQQPISAIKPEGASSVRIERAGAPLIVLAKKDGRWIIVEPISGRANETRVSQLIEVAAARSANRVAATDLQRFELDPPAAQLTFGGQTFSFGMVNALTREQYVMIGKSVYAVHPRYGAALPASPYDLLSREVLGPAELPQRIELKEFVVEQSGGKWKLTPPAERDPGQDDLARWVDGWRGVSALRVELYVGGKTRQDVRVRLKDGSELAFGTLASGSNLVLTRPDEKLQYYFRIETAKRLLSRPTASP